MEEMLERAPADGDEANRSAIVKIIVFSDLRAACGGGGIVVTLLHGDHEDIQQGF